MTKIFAKDHTVIVVAIVTITITAALLLLQHNQPHINVSNNVQV